MAHTLGVAMAGGDTSGDAYGELLPDAYEGYRKSLQLGPDEDDEHLIVRAKDKEELAAEEADGGKGGKGKGGKGRKGVDVEALKREAKMDRELVQIEKLMEERRQKRQRRDEGGDDGAAAMEEG